MERHKIKIIFFVIVLLFLISTNIASAAPSWWPLVPCGTSANPAECTRCDLFRLFKNIIDFVLIGLMPPVAAILFVWGGFLILMGGANPGWITQGRTIFWNTFMGVLILSSSWLITNTIIKSLADESVTNPNAPWYQFECRETVAQQPPAPQPGPGQPPAPEPGPGQPPAPPVGGNCSGVQCSDSNLNVCGQNTSANCSESAVNRWDSQIKTAAANNQIGSGINTVALVKAVMSQESGGRTDQTSFDGTSHGIMQMRPETANQFKSGCATADITAVWLKNQNNVQANICIAINYMKSLLGPCGTEIRNIAAGYNGGGAAKGACAASTSCASCSICGNETTRRWECLWDGSDGEHKFCNAVRRDPVTGQLDNFSQTRKFVPSVAYCYNKFGGTGGSGGGGQPPSTACNQSFGLTPASGCSGTACVVASNITPTHGCESHDGVCLLSSEAAEQARKLVSTFNTLSGGRCTLRLASTIQGGDGPSVSLCHKPGNSKSGTCADFNLLPNHDSCSQYFYQAAKDSGTIVSFLDEYVPACKPANATGGNIHVNLSKLGSVGGGDLTLSSISPTTYTAGKESSFNQQTGVVEYTYLEVPFEIQGQGLTGATLSSNNTGVDGKPGIEFKNLQITDTSVKGTALMHSTAKDGKTTITVKNNKGQTGTKDISVAITGTQYLQREFASNPGVKFFGRWPGIMPNSTALSVASSVKKGLGHINKDSYKKLNLMIYLYELGYWNSIAQAKSCESVVDKIFGKEFNAAGCATPLGREIYVSASSVRAEEIILHESAHKLNFYLAGKYPYAYLLSSFQNEWRTVAASAEKNCKYLPMKFTPFGATWQDGSVTPKPRCGFIEPYGAYQNAIFGSDYFEDISTMTARKINGIDLNSGDIPTMQSVYEAKYYILDKYGF